MSKNFWLLNIEFTLSIKKGHPLLYSPKRHTTCLKKSYAQRAPKLGRKLKSSTFSHAEGGVFLGESLLKAYVI